MVFFFASWCSRCATQQDALAPLVDDYRDVVTFVGVGGQDKPAAVKAWLDEHDVTYPVGIDAGLETWRRYAVRTAAGGGADRPGRQARARLAGGVSTRRARASWHGSSGADPAILARRMRVTLMLADSAQVADGKLFYILGGGWSITGPPAPSAIALLVEVPWDQTNRRLEWRFELVDSDGYPV